MAGLMREQQSLSGWKGGIAGGRSMWRYLANVHRALRADGDEFAELNVVMEGMIDMLKFARRSLSLIHI